MLLALTVGFKPVQIETTQKHSKLNCLKPHLDILTLTQILPEKGS